MVKKWKHQTKLNDLNIEPTWTLSSSNKKCNDSNENHQSSCKLHVNSKDFCCIILVTFIPIIWSIISPSTNITYFCVNCSKSAISAMLSKATVKMKFKVWVINLVIIIICNFDVKNMNDLVLRWWKSIFRLDP